MSRNYEKLQANIPVGAEFTIADIDEKAKELGIERTDLVIKAVEMYLNFDNDFLNYIKHFAQGMKVPEYLVIEIMIADKKIDEEAEVEVYGPIQKMVDGFSFVTDEKGTRVLRGKELEKYLKPMKIKKYKAQLEKIGIQQETINTLEYQISILKEDMKQG